MFIYATWLNGLPLIHEIKRACPGLKFQDIGLYDLAGCAPGDRTAVRLLAMNEPLEWRDRVRRYLEKIKNEVSGLIVTHDWLEAFRIPIGVARELGIPTFAIIHEGVYQDVSYWYRNRRTGDDMPLAEHILVWGGLHREIFEERGTPPDQIKIVGSVKLDSYVHYKSSVGTDVFHEMYGFGPGKPVITFALQLMDSQWGDRKAALAHQQRAVEDMVKLCLDNDYSLVLRCPPAQSTVVFDEATASRLHSMDNIYVDGYDTSREVSWLVSPEEAIMHSDLLISFNSTMLLEALVADKPALVLRYFDFNSLWHDEAGVPECRDFQELKLAVPELLQLKHRSLTDGRYKWLAERFSAGVFDGESITRIENYLLKFFRSR